MKVIRANPAAREGGLNLRCFVGCRLSVGIYWLNAVRVEEVEESVRILLYAEFAVWPGGEGDVWFEVFYLEPVFNVEGQ